MLTETLQKAFQFPYDLPNLRSETISVISCAIESKNTTPTSAIASTSDDVGSNNTSIPTTMSSYKEGCRCQCAQDKIHRNLGPVNEIEYQQQIDRLTSVVTAIISMLDSQRSREDNKNVARLTWLATFFIPLSFVASLFSMTEDISSIRGTIKWYFATSLPLALLSLGLAMILTLPSVQKARHQYLNWWKNAFLGWRPWEKKAE
ncbi:hypothetical protein HYFRA_00009450 [Hymenoscyphus fraxineus]|uniref:Uncharacterized protein n=1 Tax=Hymenoscyphus fraxineus TaxID=746836 RepID=A0A9N9PW00_9HELO|nr:hypothetical protein HYFRA_00009450 [Hymenoscyphus fraxineus]